MPYLRTKALFPQQLCPFLHEIYLEDLGMFQFRAPVNAQGLWEQGQISEMVQRLYRSLFKCYPVSRALSWGSNGFFDDLRLLGIEKEARSET